MHEYPTISNVPLYNIPVYIFDKLDGSNIRAEWNAKKGFFKFGSRKQLIDEKDELFGKAVLLIKKQESQLAAIFNKQNSNQKIVCYFEFYGINSFAGRHDISDIHEVVLLDISINDIFISPELFVELFINKINIPKLLYIGEFLKTTEQEIHDGKLNLTFEGVVCKTIPWHPKLNPKMFKVKNKLWLEKVKKQFGNLAHLYI